MKAGHKRTAQPPELGQPILGTATACGVGNFFHVAHPATGDYAGDAIEIARAAELEYGPHKPLLKRSRNLCE